MISLCAASGPRRGAAHVAVKEEFLPFYPSAVGLSFSWPGSKSPLQTRVPGRLMVSGCGLKPQETVGVSGLIKRKKEKKSTKKALHRQNHCVPVAFCLKEKIIGMDEVLSGGRLLRMQESCSRHTLCSFFVSPPRPETRHVPRYLGCHLALARSLNSTAQPGFHHLG